MPPSTLSRLAWIDLAAWLVAPAEVAPRLRDSAFEAWPVYLVWYAARLYALEVEPLLAILPLHQAVGDAFYVIWSSPMGRLSHGELLDSAAELWRECVMPLIQLGMVAAAARAS